MLLCKCLNFSDTSSKWEPNANQRRFLVCVLNPLGESEFSDLCEAIRNSRLDGKNCFKLLEELIEVPAEDAEHWDELLNTPWGLVYEQEESEAARRKQLVGSSRKQLELNYPSLRYLKALLFLYYQLRYLLYGNIHGCSGKSTSQVSKAGTFYW